MLAKLKNLPRFVANHWRFFRKTGVLRRKEVLLVLGLGTATVVTEATGMAMIAPLLGFVESGRDIAKFTGSSPFARVLVDAFGTIGIPVTLASLILSTFVLVVLRQSINYFNVVEMERVKLKIGRRLSVSVFQRLLGSRREIIEKQKPGEFSVICDYECQAAAAVTRVYATIWITTIGFIAYGAVLLIAAPVASILAGLLLGTVMVLLSVLIRRTKSLSELGLTVRKEQVDFFTERFRAWKLIKLSGTLQSELDAAGDIAGRYAQNRVDVTVVSARLMLFFAPIAVGILLVILYLFVDVLVMPNSIILLFVLVMLRLIPLSQTYQKQLNLLAQFDPSLKRVETVLAEASEQREVLDEGDEFVAPKTGFTFRAVSYIYPSEPDHAVLNEVSIEIPAGKVTALIGHSGSGKSTMIDLLSRLIEPLSGEILVDGKPLSAVSLRSLRNSIAFVPQDPFIFDASIRDNIRYQASDASQADVEAAAKLAHAHDFIQEQADGYDMNLGDDGGRLSGGQKQRIALARAFAAHAPILILDEPTSALDAGSEGAVQKSIEAIATERGVTAIVITHRLSTIRNADHVIKLENGEVVAEGSVADVIGSEMAR